MGVVILKMEATNIQTCHPPVIKGGSGQNPNQWKILMRTSWNIPDYVGPEHSGAVPLDSPLGGTNESLEIWGFP